MPNYNIMVAANKGSQGPTAESRRVVFIGQSANKYAWDEWVHGGGEAK